MNILAICGSQRKGNTYSVLNTIKQEFSEINYEILMLKDMNLKDCYGCYACINKGPQYCPLKDDRDTILKKMEEADGVIFATPTNTRHVTSLMKICCNALSDRALLPGKAASAETAPSRPGESHYNARSTPGGGDRAHGPLGRPVPPGRPAPGPRRNQRPAHVAAGDGRTRAVALVRGLHGRQERRTVGASGGHAQEAHHLYRGEGLP